MKTPNLTQTQKDQILHGQPATKVSVRARPCSSVSARPGLSKVLLSMRSEYRTELKILARAQRKLHRDYERHERSVIKQMAVLQRSIQKGRRATDREIQRINKRRAILEGRLSS